MKWLLSVLMLFALPAWCAEANDSANPDNARWQMVRKALFGERRIADDTGGVITLVAPRRAADAAVVPIAIRTTLAQSPTRWISKVYLVVDRNPSPVGATFSFSAQSGRADIETRIRVEEYSFVRAIAELNDGSLLMQARYVKAAGGCSAPAGADLAAAMARLGRMDLRLDNPPAGQATGPDQPQQVQLTISHPNVSGLAIDQLTRLAPAPHFVRSVDVRYAGKPLMSADVDFSISENPSFRFYVVPGAGGALEVEASDNQERRFQATLAIRPEARAGV